MIIVADNLQILRRPIAEAVAKGDAEPIRRMVCRWVAAGAEAIDINAGPASRRDESPMAFLVDAVRKAATSVPLVLDSSSPSALCAGLAAAAGPSVINGFSLQPVRMDTILPLALKHRTDVIGYLLRRDGHVPTGPEERMSVAVELFQAYLDAGGDPARLIIDPVVVPVTWQDGHRQIVEILELLRRLPDLLGIRIRTIAGLSNLTTGVKDPERRDLLEQSAIPMLAAAGLDMILMNVQRERSVRTAHASRRLLSEGIFSWKEV